MLGIDVAIRLKKPENYDILDLAGSAICLHIPNDVNM